MIGKAWEEGLGHGNKGTCRGNAEEVEGNEVGQAGAQVEGGGWASLGDLVLPMAEVVEVMVLDPVEGVECVRPSLALFMVWAVAQQVEGEGAQPVGPWVAPEAHDEVGGHGRR